MKINIKKLPKSEVEIEGVLEAEAFEAYFNKALKKIGENIELKGFRKGKAPENVLLSKIPEIKPCFRRKRIMDATILFWAISLIFGIATYIALYV